MDLSRAEVLLGVELQFSGNMVEVLVQLPIAGVIYSGFILDIC